MDIFKKHTQWIYVALMMLFASLLCFFELTRNSLTFDEVSSIIISRNWVDMWHLMRTQEGNMWFYFLILNTWQKLGTGEFVVRSLSAIFGVLTVPVFYFLAKEVYSEKVAKIATPLLIVSMYFVFYAQMARSYSLSLLLVTLSSFLFLKYMKKSSSYIPLFLYILISALAIYTHLLVALAILTQYAYVLLFPKDTLWKKILIAGVGIFILLIPLFLTPSVVHGHQLDWLQRIPFVYLPFSFIALGGDSLILTVITGIMIAILLWRKRHVALENSLERFHLLWLLLWAGFPIVFSYLFSILIKPIDQPQYFNFCLPPFILLVVIAIEEFKKRKIIYFFLIGTIFLFSFLRLVQWYTGSNHYITQYVILENVHPDNWRGVASYVLEKGNENDTVIFDAYYIREPFTYYYDLSSRSNKPKLLEISSAPYAIGGGSKIPEPNLPLIRSLSNKYSRVWIVLENNDTTDLGKRNQWQEIEKSLEEKYNLSNTTKFNKISLELWVRK